MLPASLMGKAGRVELTLDPDTAQQQNGADNQRSHMPHDVLGRVLWQGQVEVEAVQHQPHAQYNTDDAGYGVG